MLLKFLLSTYPEAIRKKIKQYHIGVDKKKLLCIELDNVEADSTEIIKKPKVNIYNRIFPNKFKLKKISFISRLLLHIFKKDKKQMKKLMQI